MTQDEYEIRVAALNEALTAIVAIRQQTHAIPEHYIVDEKLREAYLAGIIAAESMALEAKHKLLNRWEQEDK